MHRIVLCYIVEKNKVLMRKLLIVVFFLIAVFFAASPQAQTANTGRPDQFSAVFSSNLYGETEPCG